MSAFLNRLRDGDFTGLNRAFGKGKHSSSAIPEDIENDPEERGIRGGPQKRPKPKKSSVKNRGGVVSGVEVMDDEDTTLVHVIARGLAVFFLMVALFIYIAIAVFQKKWGVGPSSLTSLSLFVIAQGLLVSIILLAVPQIYERTNSLRSFARTLRITRVQFIVFGSQTFLFLIMSAVATASAYTGGCKNPASDPNASKAGYSDVLGGFCRNKRAAAAFWWFSFLAFAASLGLTVRSWLSIRKLGPRHPTFRPPTSGGPDDSAFAEDDDEEEGGREDEMSEAGGGMYTAVQNGGRTSTVGGYYGERPVFDDHPAPPGYAHHHPRPAPPTHQPSVTSLQYHIPTPSPSSAGGHPVQGGGQAWRDPFDEIRAAVYSQR